jgi:preprotein translocase subunit SecA
MKSKLSKLFKGDALKRYWKVVEEIEAKEEGYAMRSDEELKKYSKELQKKAQEGDDLNDLLIDAFGLVREASKRTLGQRHFGVQLIGGMVLHEGKVAEMLTGEGKTLSATLPVYLNALSGKGVHIVTVNDYLARRDAVWMGQVYNALGLTVSVIAHQSSYIYDPSFEGSDLDEKRDELGSFKIEEKFLRPIGRGEAYGADITYGTNHEFGFDYLRDNIALRLEDRVQRPHYYTIIDEVDSILIDEARTPLIISAPDKESSVYYSTFSKIVRVLENETDYITDEKSGTVHITDEGVEKVERRLGITNIFAPENARLTHFLNESLKAKALFERDKKYVVAKGEIVIVDEFTGRLMPGRRYSGGLHQALEAKEEVPVKEENRTYATITIQNYFRFYEKMAGMTGTAETSAEEFHKVYGLDTVSIPPNKPVVRDDMSDAIYKTRVAKYKAVAKEVKKRVDNGQPVLLGTSSITENEVVSSYLKKEGIAHEVLNAKNHEREGEIIAQAGSPSSVTVATNIAGRGVDIVLGGNPPIGDSAELVRGAGGLHVLGTSRHEARRIDNQLRGRSGRQGDPGSSQFFLSLEDDLMRIFGGDRLKKIMQTLNVPDDIPIESKVVSKAVNQAQSRVEGANLDMRKHLLEYDDVLTKQRGALYLRRGNILKSGMKNEIMPFVKKLLEGFIESLEMMVSNLPAGDVAKDERSKKENLLKEVRARHSSLPDNVELDRSKLIAEHMVRIIDLLWVSHLENLESLRQSVNIRAYGQHEPLVEYRKEAHSLYQNMQKNLELMTYNSISQLLEVDVASASLDRTKGISSPSEIKKIGRNDPCYCGSGKKYKKCHGK